MADHTKRIEQMTWRITPIVKMQQWPLMIVMVRGQSDGDVPEECSFSIVGTDGAEMQAMAEKVKVKLEEVR